MEPEPEYQLTPVALNKVFDESLGTNRLREFETTERNLMLNHRAHLHAQFEAQPVSLKQITSLSRLHELIALRRSSA